MVDPSVPWAHVPAADDAVNALPARNSLAAIESELVEERANALGRVGERLEEAIDTWRLLVEVGAATEAQVEQALRDVRDAAWALIVQRECSGFRTDNLAWIRRYYDVPWAALRRI